MTLSELFETDQILNFLHNVLVKKDLKKDDLPFRHSKATSYVNQYYLCVVVEFLIKYHILHQGSQDIFSFASQLEQVFQTSPNYKTFLIQSNRLLATSIQQKLQLSDQLSVENKKKILAYAYEHYIQNGYCFHSIPSSLEDVIKKDGLSKKEGYPLSDQIIKIDHIFEKYGIDNIFGIEPEFQKKEYFEITDSPSMAFFHALETPMYFCYFTSYSNLEDDSMNQDAYYLKSMELCSNNIELLCNKKGLTDQEKDTVMNYFHEQWKLLDASNLVPMIVLMKRKVVGRDFLKDYEEIMKYCDEQDIIYSLSKIMDSRYPNDRRYTKVIPAELEICKFPSYERIITYEKKIEKPPVPQEKQEEKIKKNNHGYADVIALSGILMITLGLTWILVSIYFHIH